MNILILSSKLRYIIATAVFAFFLSSASIAQTEPVEEVLDNTTNPAKQYELNGTKYTFDYDLSEVQLLMLGSWKAESGSSDVQSLQFNDSETVITTIGGKQFKAYWSVIQNELNVTINSSNPDIPSQLKGRIETTGKASAVVLDNFGTFQKTADK